MLVALHAAKLLRGTVRLSDACPGNDDEKPRKKKLGRPISYTGDINAPHLTEEERRHLRRCAPTPHPPLPFSPVGATGESGWRPHVPTLPLVKGIARLAGCHVRAGWGATGVVWLGRRELNRASARRVRAKAANGMEAMSRRLEALEAQNEALVAQVEDVERERCRLQAEATTPPPPPPSPVCLPPLSTVC